jgi:hypothetical protein
MHLGPVGTSPPSPPSANPGAMPGKVPWTCPGTANSWASPSAAGTRGLRWCPRHRDPQDHRWRVDPSHTGSPFDRHRARVEDCPDGVEIVLRDRRSVEPSARDRQMGAAAVTLLCMEAMGQRGIPRTQTARGQRARGLEHQQERAWALAAEPNTSLDAGTACEVVSSNGAARLGPARAA